MISPTFPCRALSLAMKQNAHIDVVLAYRKKYLERFNKTEDEPLFIETNKKVPQQF